MHRAEARRETGTEEREVSGIVSQVVERGYISSGSGFALIASLELRFLEFRQASPIVSPPPELRPTPHRAGWTHTGYTERVSGEIHACSRVRSHGMLDRSNPRCSFTPFVSSVRASTSTSLCMRRREENEGREDFSLRYAFERIIAARSRRGWDVIR